ncbi:MAG: hypothetical protein Q9213_007081 [Squamulea squamosa]
MKGDFNNSLANEESFRHLDEWEQDTKRRYNNYGFCEADVFTYSAQFPLKAKAKEACCLDPEDTKPGHLRGYAETTQHRESADDKSVIGILKPGEQVLALGIRLKGPEEGPEGVGEDCAYTAPIPQLSYTQQDINRWEMAKRACAILVEYDFPVTLSAVFVRGCGDFDSIDVREISVAVGFGAVAMIYGGIHAFAWLAYFRTTTEQLLWRVSACIVMGGIPVMYAIVVATDLNYEPISYLGTPNMVREGVLFMKQLSKFASFRKRSKRINDKGFIILILGSIIFWTVVLLYILARAYLVIECFIQLSHLPAGVYKVPEWKPSQAKTFTDANNMTMIAVKMKYGAYDDQEGMVGKKQHLEG